MWFWVALAWADELDLTEYVEVSHVEEVSGGLLEADEAWFRDGDACVPATLEHGETLRFRVPRCEAEHPGGIRVTCSAGTSVSSTFHGVGHTCTWDGPDGLGGGWGLGGSYSSHGNPVMIELTDDRIVWARTVGIEVDYREHARQRNPCTAKSLRKLGDEAPEDGKRTCDVSTGLVRRVVPVGWGRGIGVGTREDPEPVDCREPCPENPERAAVVAAADQVRGKRFARKDGERIGLFRTKELCEGAEGQVWRKLLEGECDPEDRPWEADQGAR